MADPIETIQALYADFGRGDVASILSRLHPDVRWEPDTVDHGIPWIRPGAGLAAAVAFFEAARGLEFRRFEPEAFTASDRHVAVFVRHEVVVKATGKTLAGVEIHWWTLDELGRITAMKHFVDTIEHLAAARG